VSDSRSSYRQIFKATSLFGGEQVFSILIGIIRTKLVAVLLGTTGVGIMGLLGAPLQVIISITGLGISFSAVRDISEASSRGDRKGLAQVIKILKRWSWFTGILGAVVTISLAPLLSQWTFGNREYTWAFIWLSVTLLLQAISKGQKAILQGTRRLKEMVKAGVIGSALGLFTSIPLYYWFGIKGIVPAMIITAVTGLYLSWYFSRSIVIEKVELTYKQIYISGLGMAKLGIFMTLAGFLGTLSSYILNAFISNRGGIDQVGLYNAGWGVVVQATGLIFAAMSTDYFPRLSAINNDMVKVKELVSQQSEAALLIMSPILLLLLVTMPIIVRILYTPAFLPIVMLANLIVLGTPLKALSWSMGYIYLAKGNGRLFFSVELIASLITLLLNLLGYYFYRLEGLGFSYLLTNGLGAITSYFILKWKYDFSLPFNFGRVFIFTYLICIGSFIITVFVDPVKFKYLFGVIFFIIGTLYSLYELNKALDLRLIFKELLRKFNPTNQ